MTALRDQSVDFAGALDTAAGIGALIVEDAIWHGSRCNWMGAQPEERPPGSGVVFTSYVALSGDLYGGTAGIGLFLAELSAATGDAEFRRTALGALRHALSRVDDLPPPTLHSLYSGQVGIALAAVRAAPLLGTDELLERGAVLARRPPPSQGSSEEFDLISGAAGSVVGYLALAHALGDPRLVEVAAAFGDRLIALARKTGDGWSWPSPAKPRAHDLTGLSHGAAGPGYALVDLYVATGEQRFRDAAEAAFRYERSWFDPQVANWPDLREEEGGRRRAGPLSYASLWCHGAPGIALSRARAYQLLQDEICRQEAEIGLATTRAALESWLATVGWNFSLCHGLAGNAEVLLEGNELLGVDGGAAELARRVGQLGREHYGSGAAEWPCGAGEGTTPNLFLGLAGIGRFYLRLHDRSLPTVLLVQPERFADAEAPKAGA